MIQFIKYALVGVANTVIGLGTIALLLHALHWPHLWATFVGNSVGVMFSYVMNRNYTFQHRGKTSTSMLLFFGVSFLSYVLAYLAMHNWITQAVNAVQPQLSMAAKVNVVILIEACIYTGASFLLHRYITFAPARSKNVEGMLPAGVSEESKGD
ncbi:GtrA family protein [Paenibacillus sp. ACRRX]|uniref:GtrA family protein n=1 Tax=Paenibacillus sp. ACRRX TaxID=2918206 RepID=UPI001EF695AC|nr:GtrA family protein [Paenibacillus sp. ACRRX]MCG7409715.1 GtrA family protein [Paenibacillus sp. ACRRX]